MFAPPSYVCWHRDGGAVLLSYPQRTLFFSAQYVSTVSSRLFRHHS
jgi:hypothetical protein